jgi:hypothetical protein
MHCLCPWKKERGDFAEKRKRRSGFLGGMTERKAKAKARATTNTGVSPLRITKRET